MESTAIDFARFAAGLRGRRIAGLENLGVLASVGSTNALARRIAQEYESERQNLPSLLLLAWEQTAGRGRDGRSWSSPAGCGVYATRLGWFAGRERIPTLPLLAGAALCRAVAQALPPELASTVRLKWPNDILVRGQKIAGILIETAIGAEDGAVVAIGFGVNHSHRAEDLPPPPDPPALGAPGIRATSLALESGGTPRLDLVALVDLLATALETEIAHVGDFAYAVAAARELTAHQVGDRLHCRTGDRSVSGQFLGFDDVGGLCLAGDDGQEIRLAAGEVIG